MLEALGRTVARVAGHVAGMVESADPVADGGATPIGAHLASVSRNVMRVSSVVNDRRTRDWLAAVFQDATLKIAMQPGANETWQIDIETREGWLRFNVPLTDLPLALGSAAITPDRELACEVATLPLQPVLERLAPVVIDAKVRSIKRSSRRTMGFTIRVHGRKVALTGADERFTKHAMALIRTTQVNLAPWAPLRVSGRLRLAVRYWQRDFIQTLDTGDIVLLGTSPSRHLLIIGTGISMQVETEMDMDEDSVRTTGAAGVSSDEVAVPQAAGGRFEDLQLPVSFEIDTARVSLGELSAMQPDFVIELDVPLKEATVRLVCHGQTIGHGQLVAIGPQVGVRITHMGLNDALAASR